MGILGLARSGYGKSGVFVICITGSGRPGGEQEAQSSERTHLRPVVNLLASLGVIGVVAGLATGRTHQPTGILCAAHFECSTVVAPGAERLVRSGCQSRETRACSVRCVCVACGLGPDSENKVRALCCRIVHRSFSERGNWHVNGCARLPASGWCA